jgi:hypothetical protein
MVLEPNSEFFKFFNQADGKAPQAAPTTPAPAAPAAPGDSGATGSTTAPADGTAQQ